MEEYLRPQDLIQRVRYTVLIRSSGHFIIDYINGDDDNSHEKYLRDVENLGRETAENTGVFVELVPELVVEGGALASFGIGLAKGSAEPKAIWNALVGQLVKKSEMKRNYNVLSGFLTALFEIDTGAADALLDEAVEHEILSIAFPYLQTAVPIDSAGIRRLKRSIEVGRAPIHAFNELSLGTRMDEVPGADFKDLVLKIAGKPDGYDVALNILHMRLFSHRTNEETQDLDVIATGRELLRRFEFSSKRNANNDYQLANIVEACLSKPEDGDLARHVCHKFIVAVSTSGFSAADYNTFFSSLVKVQAIPVLDELFSGDTQKRRVGIRIIGWIDNWYNSQEDYISCIDSVSEDTLLQWCDQEPDVRYPIVASFVRWYHRPDKKGPIEWTTQARCILKNAPDKRAVLDVFLERFRPMSWSGSLAAIMEERAQLFHELESHSDAVIVNFVRTRLSDLKSEIERQKEHETKDAIVSDERFE